MVTHFSLSKMRGIYFMKDNSIGNLRIDSMLQNEGNYIALTVSLGKYASDLFTVIKFIRLLHIMSTLFLAASNVDGSSVPTGGASLMWPVGAVAYFTPLMWKWSLTTRASRTTSLKHVMRNLFTSLMTLAPMQVKILNPRGGGL